MDDEIKDKIEDMLGQIKCPKGFRCAMFGFSQLCKARDIGMESHLECLEENPDECKFAVAFGERYFCQCPLRVFIAKKIGK